MQRATATACLAAAALLLGLTQAGPAHACNGGEAPISCDESGGENAARWMLRRVASALKADKARALRQFARGRAGFRTQDTYVFCVGAADAVMTAHPSAILQERDVRELRDEAGNHFIATMLSTAKPDEISRIRTSFAAAPGSTSQRAAAAQMAFYTRAGDQVCGIGAYDADETVAAGSSPDAPVADGSFNPAVPAS